MARQCCLLLLVTAVTVMAFGVAGASKDVTGGYLLYDCDPDPRRPAKGTAFRPSLRPLLAALPSAAAPTGFAFLHSGRAGRSNGTAFARGLCVGEAPARGDGRECLATAVERPNPKHSVRSCSSFARAFLMSSISSFDHESV